LFFSIQSSWGWRLSNFFGRALVSIWPFCPFHPTAEWRRDPLLRAMHSVFTHPQTWLPPQLAVIQPHPLTGGKVLGVLVVVKLVRLALSPQSLILHPWRKFLPISSSTTRHAKPSFDLLLFATRAHFFHQQPLIPFTAFLLCATSLVLISQFLRRFCRRNTKLRFPFPHVFWTAESLVLYHTLHNEPGDITCSLFFLCYGLLIHPF